MCILCLVAAIQKPGYPMIRTYQTPCKRRLLAEFREFIEQRLHDISLMVIEEDNGKMLEAQRAYMREFDMLEKKFALESERLE
ncbi:MAG: hypothetical protein Q9180_006379 [Flavoplaca navasiana]